jgi:hypothetical protein
MLYMPSTEFYYLSDEDLGAVIAFIKSVEPVDNELPASEISFTGRIVMTLVKDITFIPAELIPHNAPRPAAPEPGITPEYGEYLTYSCKVCHGLTMSGGPIPGFPSSWPAAPNLTFGYGSALQPGRKRALWRRSVPAKLRRGALYAGNTCPGSRTAS